MAEGFAYKLISSPGQFTHADTVRLSEEIRRYWEGLGHSLLVYVHPDPVAGYVVRSDMVNGYPRRTRRGR